MKLPRIIKNYHRHRLIKKYLDQFDHEMDQAIDSHLISLAKNEIGLATCQFLTLDSRDELQPHSSGVLVGINGGFYILTASHVIDDWSNANKLFVEIDEGHISIVGKGCGTELDGAKLDVAYIRLREAIVPLLMKRYRFLSVDKFLHDNKIITEANYCVFGYPVQNRKVGNGKAKSFASAYWVRPVPDIVFEYYGFDFLTHYVLEFKGKATNIFTGAIEKVKTQHYGLSGGGLWYIQIDFNGTELISDARLIGIMTEFRRSKYDCLVANRLEPLLALIEKNEK